MERLQEARRMAEKVERRSGNKQSYWHDQARRLEALVNKPKQSEVKDNVELE
jgi:hypothetical protein